MLQEFGVRLAEIRQSRGMSQTDLSRASGISRRMVAYYERDDAQPPGAIVVKLARALQVSTDELLGVKPVQDVMKRGSTRLLNRLRAAEQLPPEDRRALLKYLDLLLRNKRPGSSRPHAA